MIALISFEKDLIVTRDEADSLGLKFKSAEHDRFGIRDGDIEYMSSSSYYYDEVEKREDEYFLIGTDRGIYSWNVFTRPKKMEDWVVIEKQHHLVDLLQFAPKCRHRYYIAEAVRPEPFAIEHLLASLTTLEQKAKAIDTAMDALQHSMFNQKVNVHMAGGLLATYNEVSLKEDACTDELQRELNNGWRIIAICVQPDQRRPDYILGRYNPEIDVEESRRAKR